MNKTLFGYNSPATAFQIDDYPYGFSLRCKIRYWIEYKKNKGFRFCHQTTNPKKGDAWNKPKYSTYSDWMVLIQDTETGYISFKTAGPYFENKEYLNELRRLDLSGTVYSFVSVKDGTTKKRTASELLEHLVARAEKWNEAFRTGQAKWVIESK